FGDLAEEFLQRNASIMALAWNPIVTKTQRDSFERSVRAEGIAQYEIKERGSKGELIPAHNRPEHVPVLYMEPLTNNEGVLGFDLVTDPVRIEALARARTSLKPAATGWINSPRADERHPAFALFLPVYRDNPDVPIRDPRGTYLLGYATAVFRISDIISVALKPFSYDDVELTLFDLGTPADERVVYVHSAFRQRVKFTNRPPEPSSPGWTTNVNVAGRKWLLRFTPTPESLAARQSLQSWAIAAVGLLISALLGGYLLVATGHTYEVEKFAERLQTKTQELTRANKVREEFLSVMSHELKTPLAVMTGYLEVIKEGALGDVNEEQKKTLDRIFEQADDQLTMINDILQVTLMESAKIGAEQHPVNLTELLDNLRDNYTHHENNSVRVKWDYPPDLPSIVTDRTKLKQIIQNLVNNALKYTERGEIVISAWQRRRSKSIEFKVSDTGIGISKEAMSFVFDKFWQADGSDPRSRGGIGLGLYLVKRFTELLKGEVRVQSKVGKGTTFKVSIPAVVSFPALGPQLKRPGANGGGDWRLSKELQKQTLSREDRRSRRPSNRKRPAKR
ncbi:MAG: hypothetical protein GTO40_18420, partial [Deltaproteobacteria bacterium]|nr:hypothetical protein [Deltaproteobacteria bacterium]